ncbi:MAG TPA: hypothetical protein VNN98_07580, partial [Rhizomicrobium sp.]|nr:hypothetical protein [Rhizomicrobium sp.]
VTLLMQGGTCPVAGSSDGAVREIATRAASALGLEGTPVVCEIVMHQGVPHVTEISARLCGPDFLDSAIALALGG